MLISPTIYFFSPSKLLNAGAPSISSTSLCSTCIKTLKYYKTLQTSIVVLCVHSVWGVNTLAPNWFKINICTKMVLNIIYFYYILIYV